MIGLRSIALLLALTACTSTPATSTAFDWTIGTWRGERTDGAEGESSAMTMRVEPLLSGAGQIRHLEVRTSESVYKGVAVQMLDPATGHWVRQYTNSVDRPFARLAADPLGDPSGRRSVWRSISPNRTRESRLVSERIGSDGWQRTMSVSSDNGETWQVLWRDRLTRDARRESSGLSDGLRARG